MADKIQAMLLMAKDKSGRALEEIIDRVLSQPEIFVFGEFLELPNIQQVSAPSLRLSTKTNLILHVTFLQLGAASKHLATLNLFAYNTIVEY